MPEKLTAGPRIAPDASRAGAGLSRGPNRGNKLPAAAWSGTWPAPGSTLDLDFANDRGWVRGSGQGRSMDAVTFTRASSGTFVGPDGLLKGSGGSQGALGRNLLTFPQDFNNAAWTKQGCLVIPKSTSAPDYTNSADLLIASASSGFHRVFVERGDFPETDSAFSVYLKYSSSRYVTVSCADVGTGYYVVLDLLDGVITQSGGLGPSSFLRFSSFESAENGWWKVVISGFGEPRYPIIGFSPEATPSIDGFGTVNFTASGNESVLIWGAQFELGTEATPYFPTNVGQPRFDWGSTARLPPRNLLAFTDLFSGGLWSPERVNVGVGQGATAPDGVSASTRFTVLGPIFSLQKHLSAVEANTVYTVSFYGRAVGSGAGKFVNVGHQNSRVSCDVTNGVVSGADFVQAWSESVGNSWYKFFVVLQPVAQTNGSLFFYFSSVSGSAASPVAGEEYDLWGAQLEVGSTATDYQPVGQPTTTTPLAANPTCNGLLIEQPRTNRLLWCRDATNAAWVQTGITVAQDQTGIDGVANAASRLTATADGGTCVQTITLASGARTGSVYLKRLTGSGIVQVTLDGSTWSTVDLSADEWRRIVLWGEVTNPAVGIRLATSGDAVAMDYAQVEDGAFATTPILTTTAAAARGAEIATIDRDVSLIYDPSGFSGVLDFAVRGFQPTAGTMTLLSVGDRTSGGFYSLIQYDLRGGVFLLGVQTLNTGGSGSYRLAMSYRGARATLTPNFATNVAVGDLSALSPKTQIGIGGRVRNFADALSTATISRVVLWPESLAADAISAVASP